MACLILVCGFSLATAIILESRLSLNTLIERAVMIYSLAAGQLLLSIQALSLATCLNGRGLILAGIVSAGFALCALMIWRAPAGRVSWDKLWQNTRTELAAGKAGRFVLTLFLVAAGILGLNAIAGMFMVPLGDPYHFETPLFWRQNQSIAQFITHDPRITSTSFAGEALGLPGYVFCKSGTMWLAVVWLAGVLSLGVVFSLARRLGCGPRASIVAAVLLLGIPGWHQYFIEADAAMCLAGLWVGASVLLLMRCDGAVELSGEFLTRLGCSIFCFILGCGAKNTTVFLAPFFLLALAICLRRLLFGAKVMRTLVTWGAAALLGSGVLWNYACNFKWYGNVSGPPFLQEHLSGDWSFPSEWTRCCRGTVLFLLDVTWLPRSDYATYDAVCQKAARLLGGKSELAEDDKSIFNFREIQPGGGIGLMGPLVVLPAFIYGAVRCFRRRNHATLEDRFHGCRDFLLLFLFVGGYAFLCHVFLKSQNIGLWRLMPAFPVLVAPVCGLILEKHWRQIAVLSLAGLCALVPISHNLVMMGNRFAENKLASRLEDNGMLQKFFFAVGKCPPLEVECLWEDESPQKALLHESYNSREIAAMFLRKARHPAVIAFAGGVCSDAYYFFGPDLSNQIKPLVDIRKPEQLLEPPANADYLVFAQNFDIDPVEQNIWAMRRGYKPFLRVTSGNQCLFLAFQKNPNPEPRN
jgi:hypothetical protein